MCFYKYWAGLLKGGDREAMERGVEVFLGRRRRPGGPGCPAVGVSPRVAGHWNRGASADRLVGERLRCTPTWRAKCRITGSGKTLKVRTLGCARRFPPYQSVSKLAKISRTNSMNSQQKGHKIYTGSGHRCGVIPYSSVVVVDCLLG